uniref:Uncharacterized protein n=1 Tax=Arundo donax TaxID=35708 RepID=A0A0A9G6R8_ARUDO
MLQPYCDAFESKATVPSRRPALVQDPARNERNPASGKYPDCSVIWSNSLRASPCRPDRHSSTMTWR